MKWDGERERFTFFCYCWHFKKKYMFFGILISDILKWDKTIFNRTPIRWGYHVSSKSLRFANKHLISTPIDHKVISVFLANHFLVIRNTFKAIILFSSMFKPPERPQFTWCILSTNWSSVKHGMRLSQLVFLLQLFFHIFYLYQYNVVKYNAYGRV